MDDIIQYMIPLGYGGMGIAAFIAGSFFPFSSETLLAGLLIAGLQPWPLFFSATIGNVLGSMFNYWVGHQGKMEWIERYLRVSHEKLEKAQRFMGKRGAWMGFFSFMPVIGTAICITLGLMRSNLLISSISIFLGKIVRYVIIAVGSKMVF